LFLSLISPHFWKPNADITGDVSRPVDAFTFIVLQQVGGLPLELAESLFPTVQRVPPVRTVRQIWS
jgi:hypothetical protein